MKIKRGKLERLSRKTGFSVSYLSDVIAGRKSVSSKRAKMLEEATGIHPMYWLYGPSDDLKEKINAS